MMEMERRVEPKRMHIEKRVALYVPGKKKPYQGVTRNMSDAGICAGFKKLPKEGEDVVLHVFWQENMPPIEQQASLVWTSPSMPDGIVRVGLQLKDEPAGQSAPQPDLPQVVESIPATETAPVYTAAVETPTEPPRMPPSRPVIEQGAEVRLLVGGVAIETVAASIGDIREDNTVQVVLEIVDPAFGGTGLRAESGELPPEEQDWTPHPFRDAWRTAQKYLGPVGVVLARVGRTIFHLTAKTAAPLIVKVKTKLQKRLSGMRRKRMAPGA